MEQQFENQQPVGHNIIGDNLAFPLLPDTEPEISPVNVQLCLIAARTLADIGDALNKKYNSGLLAKLNHWL